MINTDCLVVQWLMLRKEVATNIFLTNLIWKACTWQMECELKIFAIIKNRMKEVLMSFNHRRRMGCEGPLFPSTYSETTLKTDWMTMVQNRYCSVEKLNEFLGSRNITQTCRNCLIAYHKEEHIQKHQIIFLSNDPCIKNFPTHEENKRNIFLSKDCIRF